MKSAHFDENYNVLSKYSDWFKKAYQARFLPWNVQLTAAGKTGARFNWSLQKIMSVGEKNGMETAMWNVGDMSTARAYFIAHTLEDIAFLDNFEAGIMAAWQRFLDAEEVYIKKRSTSFEHRVEALAELADIEIEVGSFGYTNDIFLTTGNQDWLQAEIDTELGVSLADRENVIADLAVPTAPSFVNEEELSLLKAAAAGSDIEFEAHAAQWYWVENSYIESLPLTVEQFKQKANAFKGLDLQHRINELHTYTESKQARKQALFDEHNISERLQTIIQLSERISHLTDLRKMGVLRLNGHIWELLREAEQNTGKSFDLLTWMSHTEMVPALLHDEWDSVEERAESGVLVAIHHGQYEYVQGKDLEQIDIAALMGVNEDVDHVKGQVAFNGTVSAPARVIRGRNDFTAFQDGDILITNQTTPEFVPLMKRAAGVVTEQGGITCHAAIVSRELKIPCIIGTETAMKVFKDGELITLDGTTGKVTKER